MAICLHPVYKRDGSVVPCGKCYNCRCQKRAELVFRMEQELKVRPIAFFVTLTYKDENLYFMSASATHRTKYKRLYGNKHFALLEPKKISLFLRNLQYNYRRKYNTETLVRYYLTAEYGDGTRNYGEESNRPHYHCVFFLPDNLGIDKDNFLSLLESCWNEGHIDIKFVNSAALNYVAKHQLKECSGNEYQQTYSPIFSRCSRYQGGIGSNFLTPLIRQYYLNGGPKCVILHGRKFRLPTAYSRKIFPRKSDKQYQDFIIQSQENYQLLLQSENLSQYDNAELRQRFKVLNKRKWREYYSKKFTRNYIKQSLNKK